MTPERETNTFDVLKWKSLNQSFVHLCRETNTFDVLKFFRM